MLRAVLVGGCLAIAGCDLAAPAIEATTALEATPDTVGPYQVVSIIRDVAPDDRVELAYAADEAPFIPRAMSGDGERFAAAIPGQRAGTVVRYVVAVRRDGDEVARDPVDGVYRFEIVSAP